MHIATATALTFRSRFLNGTRHRANATGSTTPASFRSAGDSISRCCAPVDRNAPADNHCPDRSIGGGRHPGSGGGIFHWGHGLDAGNIKARDEHRSCRRPFFFVAAHFVHAAARLWPSARTMRLNPTSWGLPPVQQKKTTIVVLGRDTTTRVGMTSILTSSTASGSRHQRSGIIMLRLR